MTRNRLMKRYQTVKDTDAHELAHRTLSKADELGVAPTPIHYTLLFDYLARLDPFLVEELETALQLHAYDDDTAEELYRRYITQLISRYLPVDQAEETLQRMKHEMELWLEGFNAEQAALRDDIDRLKADHRDQAAALALIERHILPRLDAIEQRSAQLAAQINRYAREMEQLRTKLSSSYEEARTDPLSTLLNRRGLMEALQKLTQQSMASDTTFAVIIFDIDFFKKINDTFGHTVGDSVIRYVARVFRNETKGQDLLARVGGEEFVLVLPDTSYDNAMRLAGKIRQAIESKQLSVRLNNQPLRFTVSAGVALWQRGEPLEALFERADRALYQAKRKGRNRVVGENAL